MFVFTRSIGPGVSNMAAKKELSFPNEKANSSFSNSDMSRLSWESFLPNHAIFKALKKRETEPKEEAYLEKNVLAEMNGDLFLWDDERKQILVANLKNLKAKNERSSKLQTLLCNSAPLSSVNKMVFSETGAYLALVGQHDICVVELPQKREKFTQYEHGKETINCRSVNVDQHFFVCHSTITVFEAKWFPGSQDDIHLVVLTSDNQLRLYDITSPLSPLDIISVGSIPPDQSLCSPGKVTFAEAFGEIVISFDFAGVMKAESFSKMRVTSDDGVVYPLFLLRENGDVLYMLLMLCANRFFYELQGCLPVYPSAEDNYGVDSCDILCFPTNPVVVAITTCSGVIYHCIVLESEDQDVFSKPFDEGEGVGSPTDSVFSHSSPTYCLCVYECIELALSANAEQGKSIEDTEKFSTDTFENKDETYVVKLFKDLTSASRYHCFHPAGIHTITLPWLRNLQQFCNETERAVSFDSNENGIVQHVICTNPVPSSSLNLIGFTVVSDWGLGATIIALTDAMECITKSLRFLNRPPSPGPTSTDSESKDKHSKSSERLSSCGEFENRIKQVLRRDTSNPLLRSSSEHSNVSPKEGFQFLSAATQTFRVEYINRQKLAQEEIERRLNILSRLNEKQMDDLSCLNEEKRFLQEQLGMLAEKYEDIKDGQELILKRIESVLEFIQSRQPVLSHAETRMKQELQEMMQNLRIFRKSFEQLHKKQTFLDGKEESSSNPSKRMLSEIHIKQLSTLLKQDGDSIQELVREINHLKLQVGF